MNDKKQIEEMREMASIMTEAALSACDDLPLMPSDTNVCYNIPCLVCKETRLLVYKGYRKQREGEWICNRQTSEYICSLCGAIGPVDCLKEDFYESNFCPNCGAKMKGGAE